MSVNNQFPLHRQFFDVLVYVGEPGDFQTDLQLQQYSRPYRNPPHYGSSWEPSLAQWKADDTLDVFVRRPATGGIDFELKAHSFHEIPSTSVDPKQPAER